MKHAIIAVLIMLVATSVFAGQKHSPYAGFESREIKAMSDDNIEGHLKGKGMGLSLAAELNHYPGPKHVLESGDKLGLSPEQINATIKIRESMFKKAKHLGKQIVDKERQMDELFAGQAADALTLESLVYSIAVLRGQLRYAHLEAHLRTRELLSEKQVKEYDSLRGYWQGNLENRTEH